jgi:uncharacterized protein involved in exopolysaccharide biosynthesis
MLTSLPPHPFGAPATDLEGEHDLRRGNRRRLLVFTLVLAAALAIGQAWNFSRPSEYRAGSRVQIDLPAAAVPGAAASAAFVSKLQLINSRPLLARLAQQLSAAGLALPADPEESTTLLQNLIQVRPVPGSEVVQLEAAGTDPKLLVAALNGLPETLRAELASRQAQEADSALQVVREELARLDRDVAARRAKLAAFRQRAGVLAEREENEAVARAKGLANALNTAVEKEAAATERLNSVARGAAASAPGARVRGDAALAAIEARTAQVNEELREMERSFTPQFMAMDPRARALRERAADLESQLLRQREVVQRNALETATEDQAQARALVERLRARQAELRPALGAVSARITEAKVLEEDLAQLDRARRDKLERIALLEADERRRVSTVTVIEEAVMPEAPFRPDHQRDGWLAAGAALLLAVFAMVLVEAFNRSPTPLRLATAPTTVVVAPQWPAIGGQSGSAPGPLLDAAAPAAAALAAPVDLLSQAEVGRLLGAAQGPTRFACAVLLLGATAGELLALRGADLDKAAATLRVGAPALHELPLPAWLAELAAQLALGERPLLRDPADRPIGEADLQSMLAGAALDAQLARGAAIDAPALRRTGIAWLIDQGLRFSDLPSMVGRVDADLMAALARRSPLPPTRSAHEVDRWMPALRAFGEPSAAV